MKLFFAATGSQLDNALGQTKGLIDRFTASYLNGRSVLAFVAAMAIALIAGRIIDAFLRGFAGALSKRADKAENLKQVNRLRRFETLTILTIAVIKMLLVVLAIYFWWVYAHPKQQPTALVGASAVIILILGTTVGPILRDIASGSVMMAEHWFGVGDFVKFEPFGDLQGVVERVTLRSTRIRGINGEIIWLNNQNIAGVRVSPKGVRTTALDLFVNDLERGLRLVEATNLRLPHGPLMLVRPLHVMSQNEVGRNLWHIVAVGETAPGREWLLDNYALRVMQEVDEANKQKVLATDPIARFADSEAERRFARTIQNGRKSPLRKRNLPRPGELVQQLEHKLPSKTKISAKQPTRIRKRPPRRVQ